MKNITVHILESSGRLKPYSERIRKKAEEAISIIVKKIPISDIDIVFYDNPGGAIPHLGMGGYCPDKNIIFISLDPEFKQFDKSIEEEILRTLAHELHHALRWRDPGYGDTLLETMISEGLADHFDIEVTGKSPQDWDTTLDQNQIISLGKLAEEEYSNEKYNHNDWFFGSRRRKIPKWTAYTLGFNLVNNYLKETRKTASELFNLDAKEFVKYIDLVKKST